MSHDKSNKQRFYAHTQNRLCPFDHVNDVAVHPFTDEQLQSALDFAGDAFVLNVDDNGLDGDGIIVEVLLENAPSRKNMEPVVWMRLSVAGAKALSQTLAHIVKMREIEAEAEGK